SGKKITDVIDSLKRDAPVPLAMVRPNLPEALVELVHELLEKAPQDRPPTALAVMNRMKAMRAGLQREQTLVDDGLPTEAGQFDSTDTNVVAGDVASAATGVIPHGGTGQQRPRTIVSKGVGGKQPYATSDEVTVASVLEQTMVPEKGDADSATGVSKTHFQTVDTETDGPSLFRDDLEPNENRLWQFVSVAAMVAVLIGCGALFVVSGTPENADDVYRRIAANPQIDDVNQFLHQFPEDSRHAEVKALWVKLRIKAHLNRLNARDNIGRNPMKPFEKSFMEAMDGREARPQRASEMLELWADVNRKAPQKPGMSVPAKEKLEEMIELAQYESKRLADAKPVKLLSPNAKFLLEEIQAVIRESDRDTVRSKLENYLALYQGDESAAPALELVQKYLESIESTDQDNP
ncbi:MAG: hypothetical protein MI861_10075, partial [Pirellulales bacterium]|nr:hypothetical protein [Pirellulales bacterium]